MWHGLFVLAFLSASLAVSSYLAGIVPLSFTLGKRHMRLLTACGTGILVGTSLIVIIPEGVETLYSAQSVGSHHALHRRSGSSGPLLVRPRAPHSAQLSTRLRESIVVRHTGQKEPFSGGQSAGPRDGTAGVEDGHGRSETTVSTDSQDNRDHDLEPHAWIGISVITGFILMYLIDKVPKVVSANAHLRPAYISLERMGIRGGGTGEDDDEGSNEDLASHDGFRPSATTTGLVIHAAADGIALGASSTSTSQRLGMIIFIALMIHKAPAAFGLTTVLLKQGLSKRQAKAHLLLFSLAAPGGALVTWLVAHVFGGSFFGQGATPQFVTGLLLLFSGGTFLYVAMHTMQDTGHERGPENEAAENGYAGIYRQQAAHKAEGPTLIDTLATVGGMLLPLLTQFGHGHD